MLAGSLAFGRVAPDTAAQDATPAVTNPSAGDRGHFDLAVHLPWTPRRSPTTGASPWPAASSSA